MRAVASAPAGRSAQSHAVASASHATESGGASTEATIDCSEDEATIDGSEPRLTPEQVDRFLVLYEERWHPELSGSYFGVDCYNKWKQWWPDCIAIMRAVGLSALRASTNCAKVWIRARDRACEVGIIPPARSVPVLSDVPESS